MKNFSIGMSVGMIFMYFIIGVKDLTKNQTSSPEFKVSDCIKFNINNEFRLNGIYRVLKIGKKSYLLGNSTNFEYKNTEYGWSVYYKEDSIKDVNDYYTKIDNTICDELEKKNQ